MSVALTSSPAPASSRQQPLRVMVVDDSVVIRGLISRWIASEPDMVVAASLRTGLDAVNQLERINPDLLRRAFGTQAPRALLIGASTGGPQALMTLVAQLGPVIDRFPVLITQHMPPTFTTILAEHLARSSHRPAHEGVDGEIVKVGQIYLAPGGRHMRVARQGIEAMIALDDGAPVNFCKPAVDPLFTSAIDVWQGGVLALLLTGMGSDGTRGGKEIVAAGGSVVAQDEASSVVWGMPGAAAHAGICAAVLPLDQIAAKLVRLFSGDRS